MVLFNRCRRENPSAQETIIVHASLFFSKRFIKALKAEAEEIASRVSKVVFCSTQPNASKKIEKNANLVTSHHRVERSAKSYRNFSKRPGYRSGHGFFVDTKHRFRSETTRSLDESADRTLRTLY